MSCLSAKSTVVNVSIALLVGVLATPSNARGQGGLSLTLKIAADPSIGGVMQVGAAGTYGGSAVVMRESTWSDTHSNKAPLFVAGLGFGLAPSAEVLANFEYGRVGAVALDIGTVSGQPLRGTFDNYQFWGLETGVRIGRRRGTSPYGIATVGFRHVNEIDGAVTANGQFAFSSFYAASTVPTFGFGGGMVFDIQGFGLGVEAMVKYAGALTPGTLDLRGTGLEAINSRGERWSLPISLVFRF